MPRSLRLRALALASLVAILAPACKDDPAKPAASGASSAAAAATASAAASGYKPRYPYYLEAGRGGKCEFLGWEGAGKDRKSSFKVTLLEDKPTRYTQTWQFYYDASGKLLDIYPSATPFKNKPDRLGFSGEKIPKGTDTVECEITKVQFDTKTFWFNGNLDPYAAPRPKGGFTDADLKAHSGEKVTVEIVDEKALKVKLSNVGDKAVKATSVSVTAFLADGKVKCASARSVEKPIEPGASIEATLELYNPLPDHQRLEATAPEVKLADGTTFKNRNLDCDVIPRPD
jgi:hypothetical protein